MNSQRNFKHFNKECYTPSGKEPAFMPHLYNVGSNIAIKSGRVKWSKNPYRIEPISDLENRFRSLASKWKQETGAYSTTLHKAGNNNYLEIISLGKDVVPFILKSLLAHPDHWFVALKAITTENPVSKEHIGNIQKMREDWISWGKEKKLI